MPQNEIAETPESSPSAVPPSGSQKTETPANSGQGAQTPPEKKEGQSTADLEQALTKALAPVVGRLTKLEQRTKSGRGVQTPSPYFTFEERQPEATPSKDELEIANERELLKVEKGITRITRDSKYQDLLAKDPTLAEILENNPLALLKEAPIDAEDALQNIIGILDEKSSKISVPTEDNQIKKEVPEAGPPNPPSEMPKTPPNQPQERKLKTPDDVGKGIADKMMRR